MSKLGEYSQGVWISGVLVFMVLSVVTGIVQTFRRRDHEWWDIPRLLLLPLVSLWLIAAVAGIVTVMLSIVVPVVRWFGH